MEIKRGLAEIALLANKSHLDIPIMRAAAHSCGGEGSGGDGSGGGEGSGGKAENEGTS